MSLIEKFKAMFSEQEQEQKFADYKLEDGTIVRVDELAEGALVQVMDEAGELSPAPAGEHTLEDGTVITVDENGLIVSIAAPEAEEMKEDKKEEEVAMSEETAEAEAEVTAETETEVEAEAETTVEETPSFDAETKYSELEETVLMMMEKIKELEGVKAEKEELEVAMSALKEENEELKSTVPAGNSAKFKKIDPSKIDANKIPVKKGKFSQLISEYRNK
jgi:hypothetical protein